MLIRRYTKIAMVLSLAAFAFLVTFSNLTDYGSNFQFVRHVLSMDTTFEGNAAMYRAITVPWMWHAGYWLIIAGEGLTFILFLLGGLKMLARVNSDGSAFNEAKTLVYAGALVGFLIWFTGFVVVGGEWFLMWQSQIWNGIQSAFRFYITILAVLIFVDQPD